MSTPELEDVLLEAMDDRLLDVHTALPGRVESYDTSKQTANVKLLVLLDGSSVAVLPNVPVAFPRGGGFFLSFPLQVGDFVFVLFSEASIDLWRAARGVETNPGDQRRHSLTGGVALPCLYPSSRALGDAHASNLVLGKDGGTQVHVKAGQVSIGSENASDFLAQATSTLARINAVITGFNTHTHPVPLGPGVSSAPTTPLATAASVATTVTKAD